MKIIIPMSGSHAQFRRGCTISTTLALCAVLAAGCSSETTPDTQGESAQQVTNSPTEAGTNTAPDIQQPAPAVGSNVDTQVACDATSGEIQSAMIQLVNDFRASPQSCGSNALPAATALGWNATLEQAAAKHSVDMAEHNFFSHTGSDGSSNSDRVTAAGYTWSTVGENIAAGQPNAEEAVQAWIKSEGHCENMMNGSFQEFAVSCRKQSGTDFTNYWTMVLGTER